MSTDTAMVAGLEPARARQLMRRATVAAVTVASVLIAVKAGVWLLTDSVSLLSSLVDSVMDAFASLVNLIAVRQALTPPDREHRFGHGKAEPLAGLGQAAFIIGSGVFLVVEAIGRLINPREVEHGAAGIGVMIFSIVVTIGLISYQRRVVRQTGSTAISADLLHYLSDIFVNGGVIIAFVLVMTLGWHVADPIIAIFIAGFIIFAAVKIVRRSLNELMDREFPDADRDLIKTIVTGHPEVRDFHDLRTRRSGIDAFVQLHIELDPDLTLLRAHEISDQVEARIQEAFPNAEIIIHTDPEGVEEPPPRVAP